MKSIKKHLVILENIRIVHKTNAERKLDEE